MICRHIQLQQTLQTSGVDVAFVEDFFRGKNQKMNLSTKLEYRSCRINRISALEIVLNKLQVVVVVLCFFVHKARNF